MNTKSKPGNNWIQDLKHRIAPIHTAMLTTASGQTIHSRPMLTLEMDESGELWFFASTHSMIVEHIRKTAMVNVSYTDPDKQVFVSVSGIARITSDEEQIGQLWKSIFNTWFRLGKNDPSLVLINIRISHAEYWDASEYKVRNMISLFGAMITGNTVEVTSEYNRIELN